MQRLLFSALQIAFWEGFVFSLTLEEADLVWIYIFYFSVNLGLSCRLGCAKSYLGWHLFRPGSFSKPFQDCHCVFRLTRVSSYKVDTTDSSLLITEPYFNLPNIQDVYDQMIFEEYEFRSYYRCTREQIKTLVVNHPSWLLLILIFFFFGPEIYALLITSRVLDSIWPAFFLARITTCAVYNCCWFRVQFHPCYSHDRRQNYLEGSEEVCHYADDHHARYQIIASSAYFLSSGSMLVENFSQTIWKNSSLSGNGTWWMKPTSW